MDSCQPLSACETKLPGAGSRKTPLLRRRTEVWATHASPLHLETRTDTVWEGAAETRERVATPSRRLYSERLLLPRTEPAVPPSAAPCPPWSAASCPPERSGGVWLRRGGAPCSRADVSAPLDMTESGRSRNSPNSDEHGRRIPAGFSVPAKRHCQGRAHDISRSCIAGQRYGRRMRRPYVRKPAQTRSSQAGVLGFRNRLPSVRIAGESAGGRPR